MEYIPQLHITEEYTQTPPPPPCTLAMCPYIPRLTEEYRAIRFSVNRGIYWVFYITPILAASSDEEPPKQVIRQIYIAIHIV
jgi:hypothetical protein